MLGVGNGPHISFKSGSYPSPESFRNMKNAKCCWLGSPRH
jgi:hypothetical protein